MRTISKHLFNILVVAVLVTGLSFVVHSYAYADTVYSEGCFYIDGELVTCDWVDYEGSRYFAGPDGKIEKDTIINFGEQRYCFDANGVLQHEVFEGLDGEYYYGDEESGELAKLDWLESDEDKFFAKEDGTLARNEWVVQGDKSYYFGTDAAMKSGLFKTDNGGTYYAGDDGAVVDETGWRTIEGKKYYVRSGGCIARNCLEQIDGKLYFFNSSYNIATGMFSYDGRSYYADANGEIPQEPRWITYNNKTYYVLAGGQIYGRQKTYIEGRYYWMNDDGSLRTDTFVEVSLAEQVLRCYSGGILRLAAPVVTGSDATPTPTGYYSVTSKITNTYLVGPTWNSFVNYWIGFIGSSVGFHDASWRTDSEYVPSTHYNNGSHGCVNMRLGDVIQLFNWVYVGEFVVVY